MTHYNRRKILKAFGALTAASAMPNLAMATTVNKPDWFIGWQNPVKHRLETKILRKVRGALPAELHGTFYRNGPAIHERAGQRLHHWFDGEGMMQAFNLGEGQVSHIGRVIETELYKQNEKAGQFTMGGFGTHIDAGYPMLGPDSANAANTSVLPVGDEVWALWEGGSAYRMQADTLDTLGPKVWTEALRGMPFSAHPHIDRKGNIWNFGQSVQMQALVIYKLSPSGELLESKLIKDVPGGMIHDFCITDRKLIFVAPSFSAVKAGKFYLDLFEYQKDAAQRVVVLDMDDLEDRQDYELPPGFQFHFGNAYAEKSREIRFTLCLTHEDDIVSHGAKAWMRGEMDDSGKTVLHEAVLKTNGSASLTPITEKAATHEFPQFNKNYGGRAAQYLYTLGNSSDDYPGETAILRHDLKSGDLRSYDYGPSVIAEEHLFIPAKFARAEDDGWLIGTTLNYKTKKTRLNILRADEIQDGPIAVFELPYALPLGFHGAWKEA